MEDWHIPFEAGVLPEARCVLVFAPHPDDEIFGCAGALAVYAAKGISIHVVVVTDGSAQVGSLRQEQHAAERAQESRTALSCVGVEAVEFWGLSDRSLGDDPSLQRRIVSAIETVKPDLVMAPSLWELHPDHVAVARTVLGAIQASRAPSQLLFYEVSAAQRVNLLLDITSVWALKRRAMACFSSQQKRQDYIRHIEALNTWRTYTLPSHVRYAEGFTSLGLADLSRLDGLSIDPTSVFLRLAHDAVLIRSGAHQEALRRQLVACDQARQQAVQRLDVLEHDLNQSRHERAAIEQDLLHSRAVVKDLRNTLDGIFRSTSWRLTEPIRRLKIWINSILGVS